MFLRVPENTTAKPNDNKVSVVKKVNMGFNCKFCFLIKFKCEETKR